MKLAKLLSWLKLKPKIRPIYVGDTLVGYDDGLPNSIKIDKTKLREALPAGVQYSIVLSLVHWGNSTTPNAPGIVWGCNSTTWKTMTTTPLFYQPTTGLPTGVSIAGRRYRPQGWYRGTAGTCYYRDRGETDEAGVFVSPDPLLSWSLTGGADWESGNDLITAWTVLPSETYQFWRQAYNSPGGTGNETLCETDSVVVEITFA